MLMISVSRRLRQGGFQEFSASLGYKVRSCFKKAKSTQT